MVCRPVLCRLLSVAGLLAITSVAHAEPGAIQWAKSLDAAMAAAKSSNKLVMADFYTDW